MGVKKITHPNGTNTPDEIVVEYAIKDNAGNIIKDTYAKSSDLSEVATSGSYADLSNKPNIPTNADYVDKTTNQVISGQKDFEVVPRVKVTHQTHNLPETYQEVEYLQSSGTQFIDSGYVPNGNSKVIFDSILGVGTATSDIRQGRHADGQRLSIALVTSKLEFAIGGYLSVNYNTTNQRHTYELDVPSRQGKMDGTILATFSASSWTSQQTLYFFARHMSSGQDGLGNVRNYSIEVYEQDQLIRQYIPCYRKSDDESGLYDTVNDVFYTNIGTGTFIVGPDIYPIAYESLLTDASFAIVAKSGNYNDLINKPTIPTVNNATLTIQKNGATVNTFTANASSNVTANITVPIATSDLTNDSGYITSSDLPTNHITTDTNQTITGTKTFDAIPLVPTTNIGSRKNLFIPNYSAMMTNTGGSGSGYAYYKLPDDGKTYTLSVSMKDVTKNFGNGNVFGYTGNGGNADNGFVWMVQSNTISSYSHTFYPSDAMRCISLYKKDETYFNDLIERYNIQLEEGDTATPYEPWIDPSIPIVYAEVASKNDIPTVSVNGTQVQSVNNNINIDTNIYPVGNTNYRIQFKVVNGQPQLVYEEVV